MALSDPAFCGPAHTSDILAYDLNGNSSDFGFVTDTNVYIEKNNASGLEIRVCEAQAVPIIADYDWGYVHEIGIFGSAQFTSGLEIKELIRLGGVMEIRVVQDGSDLDEYVYRLVDNGLNVIGTGTTRFTRGTYQSLRFQADALDGRRWKLWVDDVLEVDEAKITRFNTVQILLGGQNLVTNMTTRYRGIGIRLSDDENDRPDVTSIVYAAKYPNGDDGGSGQNQYASNEDCSPENESGVWSKWDDWSSGVADDITTFNCGPSTETVREMSTFTDPTVASVVGTYWRARARANISSKNVQTHVVERDGSGNEKEKQNINMFWDNWETHGQFFDTDPDGNPWTQTELDALRGGVRTLAVNTARDQWTAIFIEAWGLTTDPPPIPDLSWLQTSHRPRIIEPAIYAH